MTKNIPLVSFIIVNYNAGDHLRQAISSALNIKDSEVIVVDNHSQDNSIKLLSKISKNNLKIYLQRENLGFSAGVNFAVKHAHGKYLFLLNPDATISKVAFAQLLETLQRFHDQAIVAPKLVNSDGSVQPSCYHRQSVGNAVQEFILGKRGSYSKYLPKAVLPVQVDIAVAAAWLVSRETWDLIGGLDEKYFLYFEDLAFCERASQKGIPVIYEPRAEVIHQHGISAATNPVTSDLFLKSAIRYHGKLKKLAIDSLIRLHNLFDYPITTKKVILQLIVYFALIAIIMSAGYFILPSRLSPLTFLPESVKGNFLLWSWANFDGEHYLRIAKYGYQTIAGQSQYAFFPLYPMLINILTRIGIDVYSAAHAITAASFIGIVFAIIKWGKHKTKDPLLLLWILLLSPGAIYLSAIYTEPLFIFLALMTFIYCESHEWGKAALMTALATATRVNGVFLVAFLLIKMLTAKIPIKKVILVTLLSGVGLFSYLGYLHSLTGDALAFFHAQSGWEKSTATWPWITAGNYLRALTINFVPDMTHLTVAIEVTVTVMMIYLLIKIWKSSKLDYAYLAYLAGNLALPLITGSLGSMPRFSLLLFPAFIVIPTLSRLTRKAYYLLFIMLFIIGTILFSRGYWYA